MADPRKSDLDRMERALETVDEGKRAALRQLVAGAVFVAPVVASFAINGLLIGEAHSTIINSTHS